MADLEGTGVVAGREGYAEIHEGFEIDGTMSACQTMQGAPELALRGWLLIQRTELHELATFWRPT